MFAKILQGASGLALGALILRMAQRFDLGLSNLLLHGLVYEVSGRGLVEGFSLTGHEEPRCYEFGPIYPSLLDATLPFGEEIITFDEFTNLNPVDLSAYDRVPHLDRIISEAMGLRLSAIEMWNRTHAHRRDPWRIVDEEQKRQGLSQMAIPHHLMWQRFQDLH